MIVDKTSSDGKVSYNDEAHIYWETDKPDLLYTSVTTAIGKFFKKFIADMENTKKTREKYGMSFEQVVKMWDDYKNESCEYGTEIHWAMELIMSDRWREVPESKLCPVEEYRSYCEWAYNTRYSDTWKEWTPRPEALVYSKKARLAGQADLPWYNHDKKQIIVTDYKTNRKELSYNSPFNSRMLEPFETYEAGELMKYGIQLAIYSIFLEKEYKGYKVISNIIYHMRHGEVVEIVHSGTIFKFFREIAKQIIYIYEELHH